ncbi:MAG: hypothetical protein LM589_06710 [Thermosphaera sp.]|nr:hypothetical protein [Thermosphaera sp.]
MDRRLLVLIVAAVALIGVVNATVFAYRWMTGTVQIAPAEAAEGAACTGFYSSAAQEGINLPSVGTNYDAETYSGQYISVSTGRAVCQWIVNSSTYYLYESITVNIPVTVGSWYIKDFYGFGYHGVDTYPENVYVWFRLEQPASGDGSISDAYLIINSTSGVIGRLDLLSSSGNTIGPFQLSRASAWSLDLRFNATSTGSVSFTVGVYVSYQSSESP